MRRPAFRISPPPSPLRGFLSHVWLERSRIMPVALRNVGCAAPVSGHSSITCFRDNVHFFCLTPSNELFWGSSSSLYLPQILPLQRAGGTLSSSRLWHRPSCEADHLRKSHWVLCGVMLRRATCRRRVCGGGTPQAVADVGHPGRECVRRGAAPRRGWAFRLSAAAAGCS